MVADPDSPAVVVTDRAGAEVAVPGTPRQGEQAWLCAFASLVWSGPAPEAAAA
jgi:hypothetical protein